jgi:hypothetical protein
MTTIRHATPPSRLARRVDGHRASRPVPAARPSSARDGHTPLTTHRRSVSQPATRRDKRCPGRETPAVAARRGEGCSREKRHCAARPLG